MLDLLFFSFLPPFPFYFWFVWLSLSFWWEFTSAMCWSCCWIPFFPKYHQGGKCLPLAKDTPWSFFWNAAAEMGSASPGIWERSQVRQGMGPSRLVGAAPLLALWSFPIQLIFAGDKFCLELRWLMLLSVGFSMVNLRSSMVGCCLLN